MLNLLEIIASDTIINQAFTWLCKRRENGHHNDDIWHLRFHWQQLKPVIQQALINEDYQFSPCQAVSTKTVTISHWSAQDALVLKAIALVLSEELKPKLSQHCFTGAA